MPKKGQTNNPNGRPKGSQNKVTTDMKTWVNDLMNNNRELFEKRLQEAEPHQFLSIFEKMLNYALPKLQSVSQETVIKQEYAELKALLESAPDEAVNQIVERINNIKHE